MIKLISYTCFILSMVLVLSCGQEVSESKVDLPENGPAITERKDSLIEFHYSGKNYELEILRTKKKRKGTILALPGWNYPHNHWCDSTDLCEMALKAGYDLVMPTMGKTIYSNEVYAQTRSDWKNEITRNWINDSLIPILQKDYDVLCVDESNFIMGLSTGGRGALLLMMDNPHLFKAGASMSGDFEMTAFEADNLYRGFFGNYQSNKHLWEGSENPLNKISEFDGAFYFSHGTNDQVVSIRHMKILQELNWRQTPQFNEIQGAGHNYQFWNSELNKIIDFFNDHIK